MSTESKVAKVYAAESIEAQQEAYDDWAQDYERELFAMGYRIPAMIAAAFARFVPLETSPILDLSLIHI